MRVRQKSIVIIAALFSIGIHPAYAGGETLFADGMASYQGKNYRAAAKKFNDALLAGYGAPEVYIYMAHSYAACGERTKALKLYYEMAKIFKGLQAETVAIKSIKLLDPHGQYRHKETIATADNTNKSGATVSGLINRITVLPPSIAGHQPVSIETVSVVKSAVNQLPTYLYKMLDKNGVNIFIAPNMSDRWTDALTGSTPGMEETRISQVPQRTYDKDIYIFERPTKGDKSELDVPFPKTLIRREMTYALCHTIDHCLKLTEDAKLRSEYDFDAAALSEDQKKELKYYLQDKYRGLGEVVGHTLIHHLGDRQPQYQLVEKNFPRAWKWITKRMDEVRTAKPDVLRRDFPDIAEDKRTTAYKEKQKAHEALLASVASKAAATRAEKDAKEATKPEDPNDPLDVIPEEDHVPFFTDHWKKPHVKGWINGKPVTMMIDTGAYRVVVGKKVLDALNIKTPKERPTQSSYGAGGKFYHWTIPLEITVGKIKRKVKVHVPENEDAICLGQPFLRGLSYRIDNSRSSIFFTKNSENIKKHMAVDAIEIPFRMIKGNLMVTIKVDGKELEANFDTGNPATILSYNECLSKGLLINKQLGKTELLGLDNKTSEAAVCVMNSIDLGPIRKTNVIVALSATTVLGQDFFGNKHFIVDHEKKVIRFSRN